MLQKYSRTMHSHFKNKRNKAHPPFLCHHLTSQTDVSAESLQGPPQNILLTNCASATMFPCGFGLLTPDASVLLSAN